MFRKGRVDPFDHGPRVETAGEKELIPLPMMQVYLHKVATVATMRELDAVMREASSRYLEEGLGELATAIATRRRELDPEGALIDDAPDFGPVPPALLELWIRAVVTMDAVTLASFMHRIRRTWAAEQIAPLEEAVAQRRRVLERKGAAPTSPRPTSEPMGY